MSIIIILYTNNMIKKKNTSIILCFHRPNGHQSTLHIASFTPHSGVRYLVHGHSSCYITSLNSIHRFLKYCKGEIIIMRSIYFYERVPSIQYNLEQGLYSAFFSVIFYSPLCSLSLLHIWLFYWNFLLLRSTTHARFLTHVGLTVHQFVIKAKAF